MKLVVNYDVMEKVCNVNQPFGPLKIARVNKKYWLKLRLPLLAFVFGITREIPRVLNITLVYYLLDLVFETLSYKLEGKDLYADKASKDLKILAEQLKSAHIETSYDLLLEAEENSRKYRVKLNEKKIPYILEEKYILIPTFTATANDVKQTSVLQEHVMGSKEWALSLGSPSKEKKLAMARV